VIDRPKRSVTRFFVPLIDVLILLFCIFLLMPFVNSPEKEGNEEEEPPAVVEDLPRDVKDLQEELRRTRQDLARLKADRKNLSDRLSVKVLEIDPQSGKLYYLQDAQRVEISNQATADAAITQHTRQSGTREPFFLILYPRERSGYPEQQQADDYARWFKDVQFQFDRPFAPSP
jgi:septal ring factor EnvC (AmiA/AmiB activator)